MSCKENLIRLRIMMRNLMDTIQISKVVLESSDLNECTFGVFGNRRSIIIIHVR